MISAFNPASSIKGRLLVRTSALLLTLSGLLLLLACGGSSTATEVSATPQPPAAKTITVVGTLAGKPGALQFNQLPVNTAATKVTLNGKSTTVATLRPGVVLFGKGTKDSGGITLQTAEVTKELKGPIASIDAIAGTLKVLDTTVTVNADTRLEQENPDHTFTALTLADLAVGDVVSVFGTRQTSGDLLATRIERELAGEDGAAEVRGQAVSLDTAAKTFQLGTYLVNYGAATVTGNLVEGSRVELEGSLSGTTFTATRVRVEDGTEHEAEGEVELSGVLSALDATAGTFSLLTFQVDYKGAVVKGTLAAGVSVEVEGSVSATDPNLFIAVKVEVHSGGSESDGAAR